MSPSQASAFFLREEVHAAYRQRQTAVLFWRDIASSYANRVLAIWPNDNMEARVNRV